MKKDIQILPNNTGEVHFSIIGASTDTGLMLLQRLYILLLASASGSYRANFSGQSLLDLLEGANVPSDGALNSILAIGCANAYEALDDEDKTHIQSFSGESINGEIICTLILTDGTTVKGVIAHG